MVSESPPCSVMERQAIWAGKSLALASELEPELSPGPWHTSPWDGLHRSQLQKDVPAGSGGINSESSNSNSDWQSFPGTLFDAFSCQKAYEKGLMDGEIQAYGYQIALEVVKLDLVPWKIIPSVSN